MRSITEHVDRATLLTPEKLVVAPPAPRSVKIELTDKCNYRCGFCALRTRESQLNREMDFDLFKRITAEMRDAGVQEIGLFYLGEPFMAPELLIAANRWCKHDLKFPYTFLTTNGSKAYPDLVYQLMKDGLGSIKFSFNAASQKQFHDVMGVKESLFWNAVDNLRNVRRCRDIGEFDTGVYASSIRYDGQQQAAMEAFLERWVLPYVDEHYWLPLYSMGSIATQREEELGYRPTAGNQGRIGALREPLPCWALWEGHVTVDGKLSACCFDADSRWTMGDLTELSFMDAWHSQTFQDLRAAHLKKDVTGTICEACVAYA